MKRTILILLVLAYSPFLFGQNYLQYELKASGRTCGYPGYRYDWDKLYATADKYSKSVILLVTPEERRKVENEIKQMNEQGKTPRKGMDPCSTCSQYYEACIVFDYYDANVENCSTWEEWRDDWDTKVHAIIKDALSKNAFADPNRYWLNFRVTIGPDGKAIQNLWPTSKYQLPAPNSRVPAYSRQELINLQKQGPDVLGKIAKQVQDELGKIQACPFPKGTRLKTVERLPSVFHNVPGEDSYKPSPIPKEPPAH
jgi:hypothetical protein